MKIYESEQIRNWDQYTMEHEPIRSIDLMERAAQVCTEWLKEHIEPGSSVHIVCGPGNNGGDGLVIGRLLALQCYPVDIYLCHISSSFSEDNETNQKRLPDGAHLRVHHLHEGDDLPDWDGADLLVDAIFGSGLSRPVEGYWASLIDRMNETQCPIYAVDIPSGLYSEKPPEGTIVQAEATLSFERPKRSFLHSESAPYIGNWTARSIGLHPDFAEQENSDYHLITKQEVISLARKRSTFSHKGSYGHSLLVCGSTGMYGAAQLAARSAQRSGSGKVTVHSPRNGLFPLQTAVPEVMVSLDPDEDYISSIPNVSDYDVIGLGCGIGQEETTEEAVLEFLEEYEGPLIVDADALNILAKQEDWKRLLPEESIMSPHPVEFDRLFGYSEHSYQRIEKAQSFAEDYNQYVLLKGAYTRIISPDETVYYNASGNPALATAGSGDVLTGMITAWRAQGYAPLHAAMIAVYMHGLAADRLICSMSQESVTAGDLIEEIPYILSKN